MTSWSKKEVTRSKSTRDFLYDHLYLKLKIIKWHKKPVIHLRLKFVANIDQSIKDTDYFYRGAGIDAVHKTCLLSWHISLRKKVIVLLVVKQTNTPNLKSLEIEKKHYNE